MSSSRGNAADVAQLLIKEAELAAGQGQDHAVLGHLLHELGVVVPGGLGAVAAAHQEEVADLLVLDGLDDRPGHPQHGGAGKAAVNEAAVAVFGEAGQGQGLVDHRLEVAVRDVLDPRPAHQPGGEEVVGIDLVRAAGCSWWS